MLPMPRWQHLAAQAGHGMLYAVILVMPVTGWIYSNAVGYPVVYLGKIPLPNLVGRNRQLAASWLTVHHALGFILAALIAVTCWPRSTINSSSATVRWVG
ncbi:MAG: cytochrome b/b6 domain-containing protein [Steroidobacteraceae bacterium]